VRLAGHVDSSRDEIAVSGQTAVGQMVISGYQSFVGFWQIETTLVGVQNVSSA
jgi:acyl-[acyl carrier protein]--UDP-N-acetylglucosamine O-acyltransferase